MKKYSLKSLLLLITLGSSAFAGEIQITSHGSASQLGDFVQIGVTVHSKCHHTASSAKEENAKVANEIIEVMESYISPETQEKVDEPLTVTGGYFVRQTETEYYNQKSKILCTNGWRTRKDIRLKLLNVEDTSGVQDRILKVVDENSEQENSGNPQTWITFSYGDMILTAMKYILKLQMNIGKSESMIPKII